MWYNIIAIAAAIISIAAIIDIATIVAAIDDIATTIIATEIVFVIAAAIMGVDYIISKLRRCKCAAKKEGK